MGTRALLLFVVLAVGAGCGNKERTEPGEDWSSRELLTTSEAVGGADLTISLPRGFKKEVDEPDRVGWIADKDDHFSEPSVTLASVETPPTSIEQALQHAMVDDDEVERQEAIDDGFIVTSRSADKGLVRINVWKRADDVAIHCRAVQARTGGVPNFEATVAWLEKVCLSMEHRPAD